MKFKKMMAVALIGLGTASVLAACGSGKDTTTASEKESSGKTTEKTTVNFWHSMSGVNQEALNKIVTGYNNSQSKVEVKAEFQGTYEESLPKFQSVGGTKDAPTIVQVQEIGTKMMIDSGFIEPMQKFIDADNYDTRDLEKNIANYYKVDGKFYSMPFNSSTPVMYYNKEAFKKAGLDPENPPQTFEEIEKAGLAIKKSNPAMKGFALQAYGWLYEELLANQGSLLMNNDNGRSKTPTKVAYDNAAGRSIFEWAEQMIKDETFANYGTNADNMVAGFINGDVAMFLQSSASAGQVIDGAKFEVGEAYLPYPEKAEREGVVIGGASLWMSKGKETAEQEAAWDFLKYLATPEVQAEWHVATGYFAINSKAYDEAIVAEAYKKKPQLKVAVEQLQATKTSAATQGALMNMLPEERKIMETALEQVYNGAEIEPTFKAAVEQVNQAIEQANRANKK